MSVPKRFSGLFQKYFLAFSAILFCTFILLGTMLTAFLYDYWRDEKLSLLQENTARIADVSEHVLNTSTLGNNGSVIMLLNMLDTVSDAIDADIFICRPNGEVTLCRDMLRPDFNIMKDECKIHSGFSIPDDVLTQAEDGNYAKITDLDGLYESKYFVTCAPIRHNGQTVALVFATQSNYLSLADNLWSVVKMFLLSSALSLLIAFVVLYYITYRLTRPLRQMSEATKQFAAGDFGYRIYIKGNNELSELADAFNTMATDLATLETSRRSFVANVSHELKTPMTTIGGFIDGILDGTIPPEKQNYYLNIVLDEVKRLSRLVTGMLNMSKMEAGELQLQCTDFDVSEMIFTGILSFEQIISKKEIELDGLEQLDTITLHADKDMMHQVFFNLLDNAVKFTPPGQKIILTAANENGWFRFRIRNTGVGVSSEEIKRIFERFYKTDKSRSYDVKGAGLGLYLVKTIIEQHGGSIAARSDDKSYVEFDFVIPNPQ